MKFLIAETFTKSVAKLDGPAQSAVKEAAFDFQVNPSNPGFSFHKLDRARDRNFWSFRVSSDIRIIVHKTADVLLLCYADHHDAAYAWGETRRLEVHPQTGAAQIVEVRERVEEVVQRVVRKVEEEPPLFAKYEKDYLLALGVPPEWLDAVRSVANSGFEGLAQRLPAEASERLWQLAVGEAVPRPVAVTSVDPFEHPDAQRRFRALDTKDELRRALDYPWERWIVFLHPTQRSVVGRRFSGPAKLCGSAGTGKSVVAMHRTAQFVKDVTGGRVLLTTFSRTLAQRLAQSLDMLVPRDSSERKRLDVEHLHKVARDVWTRASGRSFTAPDARRLMSLLEAAKTRVAPSFALGLPFLRSEWEAIIDPWGLTTWEAYRAAPRVGRSTPLGARQRAAVWRIMEELHRLLADAGLMTWSGLCHAAAQVAKTKPPYAHVIADESQDLGPAEMTFLRALVAPGANDLFLCGDAGQRIYKARFAWSQAGVDVRGRSTRLRVNYRTTEQIRGFADGIVPATIDEGDDAEGTRQTLSLLSGPKPEVMGYASVSAESDGVAEWIRSLLAEGLRHNDIAVFGRTDAVLRERAEPALRRLNIAGHHLSDDTPPSGDSVALGTMHRAKGLEFRAVAVVGCDADLLPHAYAMRDLIDPADRETFVENERQLLYVAATRARERLLLTHGPSRSKFLSDPPVR
jgi:superfamily I DNA/RNA helicase/mRNA-degrading endonuclease RelE of RelBE toxin-antitoxin system